MSILRVFARSVGTSIRTAGLLPCLWAVNAVFAALLLAPLYGIVQSELGRSLLGRAVRGFDLLWLGEAAAKYGPAMSSIALGLAAVALAYGLLSVFLAGGIVGRIASGERFTLAGFCGDGGRFFWRYLRVFLLGLLMTALFVGLVSRLSSGAAGLFSRNAPSAWPVIIASNLSLLIVLLAFTIVQMILDYARVRLAVEDGRKAARALVATVRFFGRRFFGAWAIYLAVALLFVAGSAGCLLVLNRIPGGSWPWLIVGFLWGQLYVFFRLWIKVMHYGTAYHFTVAHEAVRAPAPAPALVDTAS